MRLFVGLSLLLVCLASTGVMAGESFSPVEIEFVYQPQSGFASNQIALWVEDSSGKVARTLMVTAFTAGRGGWKIRENSVPLWVSRSGVAGMSRPEIDAISSATPPGGQVRVVWDGLDNRGKFLPAGNYRLLLEATLRDSARVLFQASLSLGGQEKGGKREIRPQPEYTDPGVPERNMINEVVIRY
ncbi:MAG: DUF2271 domain-containing protein [Planctomycetota bacterium]|nr:DUF2271 domain-containing protein [Planctomycetota bacterium]